MPNERRPGRKTESGLSDYMTAEEFAEMLRMGKSTVYRLAGRKLPPLHQIGNCKRFRVSEIREWQEAGEVWPIPAEKRA